MHREKSDSDSTGEPENLLDLDEPAAESDSTGGSVGESRFFDGQKTPFGFKLFGLLCIIGGITVIPGIVLAFATIIAYIKAGDFGNNATITMVLYTVLIVGSVFAVLGFIVFGFRLARNKRRGARLAAELLTVFLLVDLLCNLMLFGARLNVLRTVAAIIVLIVTHTYIDPTLSEERRLQRKLRDMETREQSEDGTLGLDVHGKGFIELDFFNLFWIFVITCIIGDAIETVYHFIVVDPGQYQVRAGMLWGPFSPIYGFGAVLMTLALNRFHKANALVVFSVSAVIGGAFEYTVSWFLQFAFGVTAWDYTGTFLSIGGRTNFCFMCMWGALGLMWVKLLLPVMLRLVNLIPWQWRYSVTAVGAFLMAFDGAMTLITLDCWYSRIAELPQDNAIMQFCNTHFDNQWMSQRFQSMTIDPGSSTRAA